MSEPAGELQEHLRAARGGAPEALGLALQSCRGYLLAIAGHELGGDLRVKVSPSDLVQQTFLEAVRDFDHFRGDDPDDFRAWLRQLLRNNAANLTRDFRATAKRCLEREVALDGGAGPTLASADPTPSAEVAAAETSAAVEAALARLPPEYRDVLTLRNKERHAFVEIGRRLGRTPNAARLLWLRAIERLREELGRAP